MTERQIKCSYCDNGQDILYDRDATPKSRNLDGTHHYHVKYGPQQQTKQEAVTISQDVTRPVVTKNEEYQLKQAVKEEAIATAHRENMEESAKLRTSIDGLSSNIALLVDLVGKYLDRTP